MTGGGELVSSAGGAVVATARMGRIVGRAGWRIARQLPGGRTVEREARRLQQLALQEAQRLLNTPQNIFGAASPEEARAVLLIQNSTGHEPLRAAMGELLQRSDEGSPASSREYLFGTIISQLVPDEARILAALADGRPRASVEVIDKARGGATLLSHASLLGYSVGVAEARNTATYLARLHGFGLLAFGGELDDASGEYAALERDESVRAARAAARRPARTRLRRTSVALSPLGRDFWAAAAPHREAHPALPPA